MNGSMGTDQDVTPVVRSWLREDRHEDVTRVFSTVLDQLYTTPQRRPIWLARRSPIMNNIAKVGLTAAAVVVAAFVGIQLLGSSSGVGGPVPSPSVTPAPAASSSAAPSESAASRTFALTSSEDGGLDSTVTISAPGWDGFPNMALLEKGDERTGAAMIGPWHEPLFVYGDSCRWQTTTPKVPATSVDEVIAALATQKSREASAPVDVTLDGHPGKKITLHVPKNLSSPQSGTFPDCEGGRFGSWGTSSEPGEPERFNQNPGQIDEVWVVDLDGVAAVIDGMYAPGTPAATIAEMRAIIESIDFAP